MMLKLEKPSQEIRDAYVRKLMPSLIKRIKEGVANGPNNPRIQLSDSAKAVLLPDWNSDQPQNTDRLKELLISEPTDLLTKEQEINDDFANIAVEADRPTNKVLEAIMGYGAVFNSQSKSKAFWLAKQVGRNTCVYCNRQYVFTVERGDGTTKDDRIARPEFDHWFPKSTHPLLSISLFNLIPSCTVCNSSVKGTEEFAIGTHIHPYVHEDGHPDFKFRVAPSTTPKLKWAVKLDAANDSKEQRTIKDMCLEELYSMHGNLEVNDLMEFKMKYPDGYLKQLMHDVMKDIKVPYRLTLEEVYRMFFGVEMKEEKYLDRPFSKMKHDILHDMGVV